MMEEEDGPPNRELYALLHVSPDASEEEIRKSYRQWALIFHPDKVQAPHLKEAATENFRLICQAYEILSDENQRRLYNLYGMEALSCIRLREEELGNLLRKVKKQQKMMFTPKMSLCVLPGGLHMTSSATSQISQCNTLSIGGYMTADGDYGDGGATVVLGHQLSPVSSLEMEGSIGLRSALIGVKTSRCISDQVTRTIGISLGSSESDVTFEWNKDGGKSCSSRRLRLGTASFEASAHYGHDFSENSFGVVEGTIGSHDLKVQVGGGRWLSESSVFRMFYSIGIHGISCQLELNHRGHKIIIPVLLSTLFDPVFATGALLVPMSLYFLARKFIFKPNEIGKKKQKGLENNERIGANVREARAAADKAQQLLQNMANRTQKRQQEIGGLVITKALYGSVEALEKRDELASQLFDVALPLNFSNDGQLKLHKGVKKSGIMGFCDPCPGEPKQLYVEYTYGNGGNMYKVVVDNHAELLIPQERHRIYDA